MPYGIEVIFTCCSWAERSVNIMESNMTRSHLNNGAEVLLENINVLLRQLLVHMLLTLTSALNILLARHDDTHIGSPGGPIHLQEQLV